MKTSRQISNVIPIICLAGIFWSAVTMAALFLLPLPHTQDQLVKLTKSQDRMGRTYWVSAR